MQKKRIAIFASGTGSNAVNLIHYFQSHDAIEVVFVLSNKETAPVLKSAMDLGVPTVFRSNEDVADGDLLASICTDHAIDWVILAGYLRKIPIEFIRKYEDRIVNLHPSLLPNYGGKGMYGANVHKAVLENNEPESGITIHFVNEEFDKGRIIAQFRCAISEDDTLDSLTAKIRQLEHRYLPYVVEQTII